MLLDALGNEIIQGGLYGYSRSDSGWSHNVVGEAAGDSNGKVKLINLRFKNFLYGEPHEHQRIGTAKHIYIRSNQVFPVDQKNLND